MTRQYEDCEPEQPLSAGSASVSGTSDDDDQIPGFYMPDPESRSGLRLYWVKRQRPGNPSKRMGFGR